MLRSELPGKLLEAWLFQKALVLKRAGLKPEKMVWEKAVALWGPHMEKLAAMVEPWDVPPGLLMEAAFAAGRRRGHSQGPFINTVTSDRFLRQALSEHLDVPMERVLQMTRRSEVIAAIDRDYTRQLPSMLEVATVDEAGLLFSPTHPASYRFCLLHAMGDRHDLRALAIDTLDEIENDHRLLVWLESRGVTFDRLAVVANAGVLTPNSNQGVVDLLLTAVKLLTGEQNACRNKTLEGCGGQAASLLRKALQLLETTNGTDP